MTVNSVLPGPTMSEGVGDFMSKMAGGATSPDLEKMGREFIRDHRPTSLLGRMATIEEVANMIAYVCSPAASATSGAALRVDGGVVRAIPYLERTAIRISQKHTRSKVDHVACSSADVRAPRLGDHGLRTSAWCGDSVGAIANYR